MRNHGFNLHRGDWSASAPSHVRSSRKPPDQAKGVAHEHVSGVINRLYVRIVRDLGEGQDVDVNVNMSLSWSLSLSSRETCPLLAWQPTTFDPSTTH